MISLEQVRALEARVEKAVALIASLRSENASMRAGLLAAETRVAELEALVGEFQKDQSRIEEGILEALRKLDSFEDAVHAAGPSPAGAAPEAGKPPAAQGQRHDAKPKPPAAEPEPPAMGADGAVPAEEANDLDIF